MSNGRRNTIIIIEFIIRIISVLAILLMGLSVISMIEAMKISATPCHVFVGCLNWLIALGIYKYIVNRLKTK